VQVRHKQAAIRALEEEREQCLVLEHRLKTEMRCGWRAAAAGDRGGGSDDGGKMLNESKPHRLRGCVSDDEREVCSVFTHRTLPMRRVGRVLRTTQHYDRCTRRWCNGHNVV